MIIKLQDGSETYVSKERGDKLKNALIDGTAPEYIAIGEDVVIRKTFIVKLTAGGQNPNHIRDKSRLLEEPERRTASREKVESIREALERKDYKSLKKAS